MVYPFKAGLKQICLKSTSASLHYRRGLVPELMFADDTVFVVSNHSYSQDIVNRFARSAQAFGLKLNIRKVKMLYQPVSGRDGEN